MNTRLAVLAVLALVPIFLQLIGIIDFLNLQFLKDNQEAVLTYTQENPLTTAAAFISIYTVVCSLPVPAVALLTVAAGMLFGFVPGLVIVSFSSAIGATVAFLLSRYVGQGFIHGLLGRKITKIDLELDQAGFLYATSLRLVPGLPFFVANVSLGLTTIKTSTFYASTQIGMLLVLSILVNAGHNISTIETLGDILGPRMILALALLAIVPITIRLVSKAVKARRS